MHKYIWPTQYDCPALKDMNVFEIKGCGFYLWIVPKMSGKPLWRSIHSMANVDRPLRHDRQENDELVVIWDKPLQEIRYKIGRIWNNLEDFVSDIGSVGFSRYIGER